MELRQVRWSWGSLLFLEHIDTLVSKIAGEVKFSRGQGQLATFPTVPGEIKAIR